MSADNMRDPVEELKEMMTEGPSTCFLRAVARRQYDELSPDAVCELLSSDELAARDELDVLLAAVKWLTWRWQERCQYAERLMRCVRFSLLSPAQAVEAAAEAAPGNGRLDLVTELPTVSEMLEQGRRIGLRQCTCEECEAATKEAPRRYTGGRPRPAFVDFEKFLEELEVAACEENLQREAAIEDHQGNEEERPEERMEEQLETELWDLWAAGDKWCQELQRSLEDKVEVVGWDISSAGGECSQNFDSVEEDKFETTQNMPAGHEECEENEEPIQITIACENIQDEDTCIYVEGIAYPLSNCVCDNDM